MNRYTPITCVLSFAALVGGCAQGGAPADASPRMVCKDGAPFTHNGGCGGRGGIDRQATSQKSQTLRESQVSGAAAARKPDEVWAMPAAKIYECQGAPGYGRAKEGEYMSEADALAKGLHSSDGKRCAR